MKRIIPVQPIVFDSKILNQALGQEMQAGNLEPIIFMSENTLSDLIYLTQPAEDCKFIHSHSEDTTSFVYTVELGTASIQPNKQFEVYYKNSLPYGEMEVR